MNFNLVAKTSTSFTFELDNELAYECPAYDVYLNGEKVLTNQMTNVFSLFNLEPNTAYEIALNGVGHRFVTEKETLVLNVSKFNAGGDGEADDTQAIQAAIMSCPKGGRVVIPKGNYKVKTIFLKSDLTLEIQKGATLTYAGAFRESAVLPGFVGDYYLGSWEGNPLDTYTALIQGINVENVNIIGEGALDGNGANWWMHPKVKVGAWRPRLFQVIHSKNILVQGLTLKNSPSWTIHPLFSSQLRFVHLNIQNPKDSPNTDGLDPESCQDVLILGVHFSVGDDCIAIKSGKIYLGKKLKTPSKNIVIRNCSMNYGHGAVVIGSEMAGGVKNVDVSRCLFNETDRGLRIKTRRGRGVDAIVEGIKFKNIRMTKVLTPFVINGFYFCDPDGHSEYVRTKEALPVDERTPVIRDFLFEDIQCQESAVAAGFFYGLPELPIEKITLKNCHFGFLKEAAPDYPAMMDDIPAYAQAGLIAYHVKELNLENVSFEQVVGNPFDLNLIGKVVMNDDTKESCG